MGINIFMRKSYDINEIFGRWAESFARFFGTPKFIIAQSLFITVWIIVNCVVTNKFDPYPYILLNLVFSTQAAYAAPLILLAQTRQADRDKVWAEADAGHREEMAINMIKRQKASDDINKKLVKLIEEQNKQAEIILGLARTIEPLITDLHKKYGNRR
jgi:uncharacterized membrane protein